MSLRANVSIDQTNSKNRGKAQKIDFAQTLQFGRAISAKSCYAVGFLKCRVIIEKCANFDDATEAVILTLNFNPTSADCHRQTMHSIALKTQTIFDWLVMFNFRQCDVGYWISVKIRVHTVKRKNMLPKYVGSFTAEVSK